jgi:hypothetical protein
VAYWTLVVSAERYAAERSLSGETDGRTGVLELTGVAAVLPDTGDFVTLVAATEPPVYFGLGEVSGREVRYTHRLLDSPESAEGVEPAECPEAPGLYPAGADMFRALAARAVARPAGAGGGNRAWLVSLDLPIEAATAAEAVRTFWTYAFRLGPQELPTFVSPADDELAMQPYLLDTPTTLDPED